MNKEDAIKYLQQLYPNGGHCWLDEQRMEAIGMAVKALQEEPVSEEQVKEDTMTIRKEWFEHCKKSWYNEGYIDGEYNRDRQFEKPVSEALEEASEKFANTQDKNFLNPKIVKHIFKAGAGWMSKQFEKEEPISDDLEKAAIEYCSGNKGSDARVRAGFLAGAKWQEEKDNICYEEIFEEGAKWKADEFEKERLKQCDEFTKEQAQIESDFVTNFIKENNSTPTFIDAIEYGMKLKLKDKK